MVKNVVMISLTVIVAVAVVGGGGLAYLLATRSPENIEFDRKGTLHGTVFDATTGERLGGGDLRLTLIGSSSHRSPDKLIWDEADSLVGEYAFNDIPVTLNPNMARYKLIVAKPGYQHFEAVVQQVTALLGGEGTALEMTSTEDSAYSFIGNIYLFPLGYEAGDVIIIVERNGERIGGATVHLQQNANNNQETVVTSNRLAPMPGVYPNLTGTTDSDGRARFSGSGLVLGGMYTPVIPPFMYEGTQLGLGGLDQIIVGMNDAVQVASLGDLEPGNNTEGLYIVFASNQDAADVAADGTLTVVFNRAVALVGEEGFAATLGAGCTNAALLGEATPTPTPTPRAERGTPTPKPSPTPLPPFGEEVSAAVSTDGLTLTLTPNFRTRPASEDIACDIIYSGGQVTIAGDDLANVYGVFNGLTLADGRNTLNSLYADDSSNTTIVHATGPQFIVRPETVRARTTSTPTPQPTPAVIPAPPPTPFATLPLPESPHNYPNGYDNTWSYTLPGNPSTINVTFDTQTQTESCCDRIRVMDGEGNQIPESPFSDTTLAGRTVNVPGDTVQIRLTTDSSVTRWGFRVTGITAEP